MKRIIFACILISLFTISCEDKEDITPLNAPEVQTTDNGDQPEEPDPFNGPG